MLDLYFQAASCKKLNLGQKNSWQGFTYNNVHLFQISFVIHQKKIICVCIVASCNVKKSLAQLHSLYQHVGQSVDTCLHAQSNLFMAAHRPKLG
jgi:hypothetical protein